MRNRKRFTLPAGKYWIGDPCYPFPNDGPKSHIWSDVISMYDYISHPTHAAMAASVESENSLIEFWADGTAYGDGSYVGTDGKSYPVDSGLIGIMTMATVEFLGNPIDWLATCGSFVEIDHEFDVVFNKGLFRFDGIEIDTEGYDDDDDDFDDYDYEG